MMTLYYAPRTRAVRPRWVLEEVGAPYQLVRLDIRAGDQRKPDYLRINPNGSVPTLVDEGLTLFESAAICEYLTDRFPEAGLAPALGTAARGLYYQWIHFTMATLEPPIATIFAHTVAREEHARIPQLVTEARGTLGRAFDVVDAAVRGREFVVGDAFTTADVMLGSTLAWAQMSSLLDGTREGIAAYTATMARRPALRRAMAD